MQEGSWLTVIYGDCQACQVEVWVCLLKLGDGRWMLKVNTGKWPARYNKSKKEVVREKGRYHYISACKIFHVFWIGEHYSPRCWRESRKMESSDWLKMLLIQIIFLETVCCLGLFKIEWHPPKGFFVGLQNENSLVLRNGMVLPVATGISWSSLYDTSISLKAYKKHCMVIHNTVRKASQPWEAARGITKSDLAQCWISFRVEQLIIEQI